MPIIGRYITIIEEYYFFQLNLTKQKYSNVIIVQTHVSFLCSFRRAPSGLGLGAFTQGKRIASTN